VTTDANESALVIFSSKAKPNPAPFPTEPECLMTDTGFFRARFATSRLLAALVAVALLPWQAHAEHDGKVQILLLGDSTTEGSIPRVMKPEGPHLETVLEQLLASEQSLPPCHVINSSLSGEYIRRLLDSGRYDRDAAKLPGVDYIFIRYGLNDRARVENFSTEFPKHFHELIDRLRNDHPDALLIPMTVIPFADKAASDEINDLVRLVAQEEKLAVFDIYPRYAAELKKGPNMLNYRRYPLEKVPKEYHALVKPFVHGPSVLVMANELDAILGHLPGWFGDRHPNLAGYNVIADETSKYLVPMLRR
jgi:lysophospholipase L1-like esterase